MTLSIIKEITSSSSDASFHYAQSTLALSMEKDGQQTLLISMIAGLRLHILSIQLQKTFPNLPHLHMGKIAVSIGLIPSVIFLFARKSLQNHSDSTSIGAKLLKKPCQLIVNLEALGIGNGIKQAFQHVDTAINVACLVSYVAFIALGFYIPGVIGLAGLSMLALKRHRYLPLIIDRNIETIVNILSISSIFTAQTSTLIKAMQLLTCSDYLFEAANRYSIKKYLPEWARHPMHDEHRYDPCDWKAIKTLADAPDFIDRFSINRSHIHTNILETILPIDFIANQKNAKETFTILDARIKEAGIELTEEEQTGLKNLDDAATTGRVNDVLLPDVEKFQKIILAIIESILMSEDFPERIKEFAQIAGSACTEGWTREVSFMLSPQTKDIQWAVHYQLANQRGEALNGIIGVISREMNLGSLVGGNNNTHFLDNIHAAFWHYFRTFKGELHFQMNPHSLIGACITYYLLPRDSVQKSNASVFSASNLVDNFYMSSQMTHIHPVASPYFGAMIPKILDKIKEEYFDEPKRLINCIYEAINPSPSNPSPSNARKIPWEAVRDWLPKINNDEPNKGISMLNEKNEKTGYDAKWVESDDYGNLFLTREGVALLLYDMGILTLKET